MSEHKFQYEEVIKALESARDFRIKQIENTDSIIAFIKESDLKSIPLEQADTIFMQAAELSGELPYSFRFRNEPSLLNLTYFKSEWRMYNYKAMEAHIKEFHMNHVNVSCHAPADADHLFQELLVFGFHRICTIKLIAKDDRFYITLKQGY